MNLHATTDGEAVERLAARRSSRSRARSRVRAPRLRHAVCTRRDGCSVLDAVSSAHASPRAPPPHFRLRPTDCLLLSGAPRTTPFDFSRLLGAVSGRGGLHVEGCSVGSRGRVFTREARGWGGWSGQDRSGGAEHLILSLFRHHFFTFQRRRLLASPARHCLYCLTTSSCVCVS